MPNKFKEFGRVIGLILGVLIIFLVLFGLGYLVVLGANANPPLAVICVFLTVFYLLYNNNRRR
jgi:hypothetical protein